MSTVEALPWDSEILGVRVGRIAAGVPTCLPAWGFDLVYAKVEARETKRLLSLQRIGFQVVTGWVDWRTEVAPVKTHNLASVVDVCWSCPSDAPSIRAIAASSFTLDRFHRDPRIEPERADALHGAWAEAHINPPHCCAIGLVNDDVVGFVAYDVVPEPRIVLNAVAETYRGHGHYRKLLTSVVSRLVSLAGSASLETQCDNYPVHRACLSLGMKPVASGFNLHWWR